MNRLVSNLNRYWEGRKIWSTMTLCIRTLTRCIWVMVEESEGSSKDIVEKTSAINLLLAFAFATRNYLREEYSYDEKDLKELISHFPKFSTPSSNQPLEMQSMDNNLKRSVRMRKRSKTSLGSKGSGAEGSQKEYHYMAHDIITPTNIPIELSYYIASYIKSVNKKVDGSTLSVMNNGELITFHS